MAWRRQLALVIKQAFATAAELVALAHDLGLDPAVDGEPDRAALIEALLDGALATDRVRALLDAIAARQPAWRAELDEVRATLPIGRGQSAEPPQHGATPDVAMAGDDGGGYESGGGAMGYAAPPRVPVIRVIPPPARRPDLATTAGEEPPLDRVAPERAAAPAQEVNLGFATADAPDHPIVDRTLGAGEWYVLWVDVQPKAIAGSLPGGVPLTGLHVGDVVDVIVFGFPDQLRLGPERHGRIRITGAVNQVVDRAAEMPPSVAAHRLGFRVRAPWRFGRHALRCNLYHRGLLLQSHLVSVEVTWFGRARRRALQRVCDYNLSASLDTARLGPGTEHKLSVLINDDGAGTHSFRFVASDDGGVPAQIHDGHLDGVQLAEAVDYARRALQWVAWNHEGEWDGNSVYRFATPPEPEVMASAYKMLAVRGANLWGQMITQFGIVGPEARALRERMRKPGKIQVALKASPDAVVPMAMVYDYPLDPARRQLAICEVGLAAIANGQPLADQPCWNGACPHYDDDKVVCVGGFWGFRHELGLPIHLPGGEVATVIARGGRPRGFAPISLDAAFVLRPEHLARLDALGGPGWLEILDERDACIKRLVGEPRPLIYFYCHGGLTALNTPFLEIGPRGSDGITAQSLIDKFLHWSEPTRPLVILNGCHTTATSPKAMFSLLAALARQGNAAGIVGTEITNFEPIAVQVGTELVTRFLAGEELGRAVKLARLSLLAQGNPLGLMYIPFALPTLHLEPPS